MRVQNCKISLSRLRWSAGRRKSSSATCAPPTRSVNSATICSTVDFELIYLPTHNLWVWWNMHRKIALAFGPGHRCQTHDWVPPCEVNGRPTGDVAPAVIRGSPLNLPSLSRSANDLGTMIMGSYVWAQTVNVIPHPCPSLTELSHVFDETQRIKTYKAHGADFSYSHKPTRIYYKTFFVNKKKLRVIRD